MTALFTFVAHLVDVPAPEDGPRDGVDLLFALAGERHGPAVILAALLQALGEHAAIDDAAVAPHSAEARGLPVVRVELHEDDLASLPPHAAVWTRGVRYFVPLDPRAARRPFGFVPGARRRASVGGYFTRL